jgi:fibronectin type 3 domain-containing protein
VTDVSGAPLTSYTPGLKKTLRVTVSQPGKVRWGFELSARLASDQINGQAGDLSSIDTLTLVKCDDGKPKPATGCPATAPSPVQFIEHTLEGTQAGIPDSVYWDFDWTPPYSAVGDVVIYVAALGSDGGGGTADDDMHTTSVTLSPTVATGTGLVAAYSFSEGSGNTVADDSGTGNHGTITGATWTAAGKFGPALVFNGTTARVTVPNAASLQLTTQMTLEAWVNPSAVTSAWRDVVYKDVDNYYLMATSTNASRPVGGGTFAEAYGAAALPVNTWTHLATTYDRTTLRLYVNGVQVASQAATGAIATSTNPLTIGSDATWGQYFQGQIDEVRVYNVALTATQIQADMSSPIGVAAPDTQPPTAPGNFIAAVAGENLINLSWTAATDNVGVAEYRVERCTTASCAFTQIAATSGSATTYSDTTALLANTAYSYRVRAADAVPNLGAYSNIASATTTGPDTQAPTAPTNLTATGVSSSQVNLAWTAATDNVGVTEYWVEACQGASCTTFAYVGTSTATTFNHVGLAAATSYSYRVRAKDAALNLSLYSNIASATTQASPAIAFVQANSAVPQSPVTSVTVPFPLAQSSGNLNVVVVGWNDDTGLVQSVNDTRGNTYIRAIGPTVRAGFATQSIYYASNISASAANTNIVTVTFNTAQPYPDIRIAEYRGIAAVSPVDVVAVGQGSGTTSATSAVSTTSATDLLLGANIVAGRTKAAGAGFISRVITKPDGDILEDRVVTSLGSYSATATLTSGAWIMQLVAFKAAPTVPDTQAPTPPGNLTAAASGSVINLSWAAAIDNVGVTEYRVERCLTASCTFTQIGATPGAATGFSDTTGLVANTSYSYRVRAADAAANLSVYSNSASATTESPDTQAPTAPGNLTATAASGSVINLSWAAALDNVGVTGYRVERCLTATCTFAQIAVTTGTATSFGDTTGLVAGTSYSYRVRATDSAANLSAYSNTASAITLATVSGLVAAYSFGEGSGSTVADASGAGNAGIIVGATWTAAGRFGSALVFNGTNAKVTVPNASSLQLTTGMTLEAWVNPSVITSAWRDVIYKDVDNYYLMATSTNASRPVAGGTFAEAIGATALPVNAWTHLATTYDKVTLRLYINGVQVASTAAAGAIATSTNPLTIGGDATWGQYFGGVIDEVRVYNVALTAAQIQADMNAAVGGTSAAVSLSAASINFADQATGTTSPATVITLTNVGAADLTFGGVALAGPNSSDFACSTTCSAPLAPGGTCTISATFTPTAAGLRTAAIAISDNAPGAPQTIALSGTATGLSISPQTTVLTPAQTQQFTASGGVGNFIWSVDGVVGGGPAYGTITSTGLYTPPGASGTHTVTVTIADPPQAASATVHVTTYPGVFTHHNDNLRTGQNLNETVLTPANVTATNFGKLFSYPIDGIAHASPLYVANVSIPGQGFHNVVYVATEHDSVYAFDADGLAVTPLWKRSFIDPPAGVTPVPAADTGEVGDIAPEIGITGTPVIDQSSGTLYVVAKTKEVAGSTTNYLHRLHALDITNGTEKFGGPVVLQASVPGTGTGTQGGQVAFNSLRENQRPALLLSNGVVYIAFASHGDNQPYHGWVLGYSATTLQRVVAFNATPNNEGAGIWQSGGGLAGDAAGNVYFVTGDGTFTASTGGIDYGDSFVKISSGGAVLDYFTPHDQLNMDTGNVDLGAAGLVLLPDQTGTTHPHLLVSAGKNGTVYLVDRDNMGHYNSRDDSQIVQSLVNIFPFGVTAPGNHSAPVYFNHTVYFAPVDDNILAFTLANGLLSPSPTSRTPAPAFAFPGGSLAISANGNTNGILWAVRRNETTTFDADQTNPGVLHAYDAANLGTELYNSDQSGPRDTLSAPAKYNMPVVANGKVFIATTSSLIVYGLLR